MEENKKGDWVSKGSSFLIASGAMYHILKENYSFEHGWHPLVLGVLITVVFLGIVYSLFNIKKLLLLVFLIGFSLGYFLGSRGWEQFKTDSKKDNEEPKAIPVEPEPESAEDNVDYDEEISQPDDQSIKPIHLKPGVNRYLLVGSITNGMWTHCKFPKIAKKGDVFINKVNISQVSGEYLNNEFYLYESPTRGSIAEYVEYDLRLIPHTDSFELSMENNHSNIVWLKVQVSN